MGKGYVSASHFNSAHSKHLGKMKCMGNNGKPKGWNRGKGINLRAELKKAARTKRYHKASGEIVFNPQPKHPNKKKKKERSTRASRKKKKQREQMERLKKGNGNRLNRTMLQSVAKKIKTPLGKKKKGNNTLNALNKILNFRKLQHFKKKQYDILDPSEVSPVLHPNADPPEYDMNSWSIDSSIRCKLCKAIGHTQTQCQFARKGTTDDVVAPAVLEQACVHCNKVGHSAKECPSKPTVDDEETVNTEMNQNQNRRSDDVAIQFKESWVDIDGMNSAMMEASRSTAQRLKEIERENEMTLELKEKEKEEEPKVDVDNENEKKEESENKSKIRISNAPNTFEPGTTVELPTRIGVRNWKTVRNVHGSVSRRLTKPNFGLAMWKKRKYKSMKTVEDKLREDVRSEILMARMKKKQRDEMRKKNILKGAVVVPIRNMYKLKKLKKKQWDKVIKSSVEIKMAKNTVRSNHIPRESHKDAY